MFRLQDWAIEVLNYFWIGSSYEFPNHCHYHQLHFRREEDGTIRKLTDPEFQREIDRTLSYKSRNETRTYYVPQKLKYDEIPKVEKEKVRILVMSDTHERHQLLGELPKCDLLIHAGDILLRSRLYSRDHSLRKYKSFAKWFEKQQATHKIILGGNHDMHLEEFSQSELEDIFPRSKNIFYLHNELITLNGLNIFACPFSHGRSQNRAFQSANVYDSASDSMKALAATGNGEKSASSSKKGIDILITHSETELHEILPPSMLYIYGHIHESYGLSTHRCFSKDGCAQSEVDMVAAPILDADFQPTQLPIVVDCIFH